MNTKEMIEVMQAFEDGKDIQFHDGAANSQWMDATKPGWYWPHYNYRIKKDPKPEKTLENRVKAEYGDFDVVMLEWEDCRGRLLMPDSYLHIDAQSMKGFAGYVYLAHPFTIKPMPVMTDNGMVQPIAVLFSRGNHAN